LDYFEQIGGLVDEKNKKSVFTAIYVGGMTEIRGIRQIIEANRLISARKKIKLVMAGPFSDNGFENEIKANPEWKKIDYLGVLPIKDVYKEITAADVGLVCLQPEPNYVIAQPIKMFEYMAAGIPVIASNFSKYREIIENNKCGLCVDPRDPAKIADAIIHIMEHPDEARKMGENGRKAVRELYNWEKEEEKLLETYKRLLS
jgi:glycosyltransferase involved in cell wall biosynthesis